MSKFPANLAGTHFAETSDMVAKHSLLLLFLAVAGAALSTAGCTAGVGDDGDDEGYADGVDEDGEDPPVDDVSDALRSSVDCHETTQTAYRGGEPFTIHVIHVGGKAIAKPAGHAFLKMQKAADAAGVRLSLTSGFRTMAEQQHLYHCYKTKSCNGGHLAARPGYSNHQSGSAVDVSTSRWLARNASRFGFVRTVPSEAWHYEHTSNVDPGGPCSP
jgi:hypothetical protein